MAVTRNRKRELAAVVLAVRYVINIMTQIYFFGFVDCRKGKNTR
jgi:hypothetical protein